MDDHANRHKLMQAIKGALIGYERTSSQRQPISVAGWDIQQEGPL